MEDKQMNDRGDRGGFTHVGPLRPLQIPETDWPTNPLLARALAEGWIAGDEFRPHGLTAEQTKALSGFKIVREGAERSVRMPPRVNADWFIDGGRVLSSEDLIRRVHNDIQRYYLVCLDPGFDYAETIIAVTDAGVRRFFTTHRGDRLIEVESSHFMHRRDSENYTLDEMDTPRMRRLETEMHFTRSVVDKKPIDPEWAEFLPTAAGRRGRQLR